MVPHKFLKISNVLDVRTGELADTFTSADIINKHFCSVGKILNDRLPTQEPMWLIPDVDCIFQCEPNLSVHTIDLLIDSIDVFKSFGCRNIPSHIYKDALSDISR